jgi:hypothetical protein
MNALLFYLSSHFYQMLSIMEIHIPKVRKIILFRYALKLKVYSELNICLFLEKLFLDI